MNIEEIINSNDLILMKRHLRRLYDNYEIATKREVKNVAEKIELLKENERLLRICESTEVFCREQGKVIRGLKRKANS